jgi:UDP-N-acetyl-D-mannosaminuronic acid dehydrogenase
MSKYKEKICVLGLGYIGLPTAAILSNRGFTVHGVDVNQEIVETINKGDIHIIEPGLNKLVKSSIEKGKLIASTVPKKSDIYLICVPTPFKSDTQIPTPNIDYVLEAAKSISSLLEPGNIVIIESTSPVGTTEEIARTFREQNINTDDISIAYCPERVLPGKIINELIENDRIVGGINDKSSINAANFYKKFIEGDVIKTSSKTAEMCKLSENSFRDLNIAFANELSILCDRHDIDVWELIELANHHPRVEILQPGAGVGGHCIAVDPWFIVSNDPENAKIIKTAREINNYKPQWIVNKTLKEVEYIRINKKIEPKVACLGLSFKPDIDDLRESPAIDIVRSLYQKGLDVACVEPNINSHDEFNLTSLEDIMQYDLILILVKHKEFDNVEVFKNLKRSPKILNFCGAKI